MHTIQEADDRKESLISTKYNTMEVDVEGEMCPKDSFWALNKDFLQYFGGASDTGEDVVLDANSLVDVSAGMGKQPMTGRSRLMGYDPTSPWDLPISSFLLVLIGVGYALPWIAIGSLVSYFTEAKGCMYFIFVYVAYYGPGLPVAVMQTAFDADFDARHSSRVALGLRGLVCWTGTLVLLVTIRVELLRKGSLLAAMVGLSITTWTLHGSTSQLAQLLPRGRGVIAQQLGFALPAVLAMATVWALGIRATATEQSLDLYFYFVEAMALLGAMAWFLLLRRPLVVRAMASKDLGAAASAATAASYANPAGGRRHVASGDWGSGAGGGAGGGEARAGLLASSEVSDGGWGAAGWGSPIRSDGSTTAWGVTRSDAQSVTNAFAAGAGAGYGGGSGGGGGVGGGAGSFGDGKPTGFLKRCGFNPSGSGAALNAEQRAAVTAKIRPALSALVVSIFCSVRVRPTTQNNTLAHSARLPPWSSLDARAHMPVCRSVLAPGVRGSLLRVRPRAAARRRGSARGDAVLCAPGSGPSGTAARRRKPRRDNHGPPRARRLRTLPPRNRLCRVHSYSPGQQQRRR